MEAAIESLRRTRFADAALIALGVLAAMLAAMLIVVASDQVRQPVMVGLVGVLTAAPIAVRVIQRRWDPFEPLVIICIAGFVLFFLRPLWMWMNDSWYVAGTDTRDGLTNASLVALTGFIGLIAGYGSHLGARLARRVPAVPDSWDPRRVVFACAAMLVGATFLFLLFIGTGGGFGAITTYFSGRDSAATQSLVRTAGGEPASSAYLYLAPYVSAPLVLVLREVWRRSRKPLYASLGIAVCILVFLMTVPRGDRTYLLALILPLIAIPYLRSGRRPKTLAIIAGIGVAMLLANALLDYRVKQDRDEGLAALVVESVSDPLDSVDKFMLGPDVAAVSILSAQFELVPSRLDYKPGQALTTLFALPFPGKLWKGKPEDPSVFVDAQLFPSTGKKALLTTSMFGSFYADGGFVATLLYCLLVGLLLRILFEYWKQNRTNMSVVIVYAAMLPLLIILFRANLAAAGGLSLFLVAPIAAAFWWGARAGGPRRAG